MSYLRSVYLHRKVAEKMDADNELEYYGDPPPVSTGSFMATSVQIGARFALPSATWHMTGDGSTLTFRCGCSITLRPGDRLRTWGPCEHGTWLSA